MTDENTDDRPLLPRRALVVTFDRLPATMLGCYGNEWIETPTFDALASRSAVFEQHFAEIPGPASPTHPWWTGRFEFFSRTEAGASPIGSDSPLRRLVESGVRCRLLAEQNAGLPGIDGVSVETVAGAEGLDAERNEVPFAKLVERGVTLLAGSDVAPESGELLWLHSQGVPSPWLPPLFFAGLYLDELEDDDRFGEPGDDIVGGLLDQFASDPALVDLLLSDRDFESDDSVEDDEPLAAPAPTSQTDDSDESIGETGNAISRLIFAGYVSLLDHCLKSLLAEVDRSETETLLIVSAAGGQQFDERGPFVPRDQHQAESTEDSFDELCEPVLKTPLILCRTGRSTSASSDSKASVPFGTRHLGFVQPPDLPATLLDWFGLSESVGDGRSLLPATLGKIPPAREIAVHAGEDGTVGIRDAELMFVAEAADLTADSRTESAGFDASFGRLYAKPDDVWDVNNLSRSLPEDRARMSEMLSERLRAAGRDSTG
jgi:hypothetical protein